MFYKKSIGTVNDSVDRCRLSSVRADCRGIILLVVLSGMVLFGASKAEALTAQAAVTISSAATGVYGNAYTATATGGNGTGAIVSTSHGDMKIEDLKVGDLVYAYDFANKTVVESHVIETPRHFTYNWMSVTIDGETLRATRGHRFWVESEKNWVEAVDLKEGMTVRLSDGRIAAITAVSLATLAQSEPTYNLEIENQHTYFVGQHHVLVHNPYPLSPQYPPATQVGQNFQFNFDTSFNYQNSRSAGVARALAAGIINPGEIGHHINSVMDYPWLAAEPANIQGVATTADHLDLHGGNWRNPTSGSLVPCY